MKKKEKIRIILCFLLVFAGGAFIYGYQWSQKIESRMLLSVLYFTNHTLKNPAYLCHNIDIMEVFQDYANNNVTFHGDLTLSDLEQVDSNVYFSLTGERSFEQKRMAVYSNMSTLIMDAGQLNLYSEDQTVYVGAPLLGDKVGYTFPTGINLFPKMPSLTSDIDQKWFKDNRDNIIQFTKEIGIKETGRKIEDEDGTVSEGFEITIPQGSGKFIFELLGMDMPDHDVDFVMYLTKKNQLRRMEMDLSKVLEGAKLVIDGIDVGTMCFTYELPQNEHVEMVLVRNPDFQSRIDATIKYYANNSKIYKAVDYITWQKENESCKIKIKDIVVSCDDEKLATGYYIGYIDKASKLPKLYEEAESEIPGYEVLDWYHVRDNSKEFVDDVLSKTSFADLWNKLKGDDE